jgi:ABC-2 type transport system ATP-binding protein
MEIIRVQQILKKFEDTFLLGPLDFSVAAGEVLGVVGPTNAGKTTLLKLLWGFIQPSQGHVAILGMQPHLNQLRLRRFAGYLSQNPQYYSDYTAKTFLCFAAHFYEGWEETRACALLDQFDIDPDAKLHMLSKGDCRKLGIVAACAHRPSVLLLDEPVSGIDHGSRLETLNFLKRLACEKRVAIVISSRTLRDIDGIADSLLTLPSFNNRRKTRLKHRQYREQDELFKS